MFNEKFISDENQKQFKLEIVREHFPSHEIIVKVIIISEVMNFFITKQFTSK